MHPIVQPPLTVSRCKMWSRHSANCLVKNAIFHTNTIAVSASLLHTCYSPYQLYVAEAVQCEAAGYTGGMSPVEHWSSGLERCDLPRPLLFLPKNLPLPLLLLVGEPTSMLLFHAG